MMTHVDLDLSNKQTCDWLKLLKKKKTSALQPQKIEGNKPWALVNKE